MNKRQISLRLEAELVEAINRIAREESLGRATTIRRLLEQSVRRWGIARALDGYQRGELSLGRAAQEAGLTHWEVLDAVRTGGIAYALEPTEVRAKLRRLLT